MLKLPLLLLLLPHLNGFILLKISGSQELLVLAYTQLLLNWNKFDEF